MSLTLPRSRADTRSAALAGAAAISAAVLLPVGMALANKSAPVSLGLASLFAVGAVLARGWGEALARPDPWPGAMVIAFAALGAASLAWSVDTGATLRALREGAVPLAAGAALVTLLPGRAPPWLGRALCAGLLVAAAVILVELRWGLPLRHLFGARAISFELNRPTLTVLALVPALLVPRALGRGDGALRLAAGGGVLACVAVSDSGTAVLGLLAGAAAYGLARFAPRAASVALPLALGVAVLAAPYLGSITEAAVPPKTHQRLAEAHSEQRAQIWRSFQELRAVSGPLGTGLGTTSAGIATTPQAALVPPEYRVQLAAGHPHDAYLQLAVELGWPGQLLALGGCVLLTRALLRRPGLAPPRVALGAGIGAIVAVGHGAWQPWWIAVVFAAVALLRAHEEITFERA